MNTLRQLIDYLENSIERAESDDWCALTLSVAEAEKILPSLRENETLARDYVSEMNSANYMARS